MSSSGLFAGNARIDVGDVVTKRTLLPTRWLRLWGGRHGHSRLLLA